MAEFFGYKLFVAQWFDHGWLPVVVISVFHGMGVLCSAENEHPSVLSPSSRDSCGVAIRQRRLQRSIKEIEGRGHQVQIHNEAHKMKSKPSLIFCWFFVKNIVYDVGL
ncbi:hypothetical protein I3843_10G097000 [Carya illinoinensis]|nr:hypothetical protein I3843_10G097000 [Carya illinoinensis]